MKYLDEKTLASTALYAVHEVRYELEAGTASLAYAMALLDNARADALRRLGIADDDPGNMEPGKCIDVRYRIEATRYLTVTVREGAIG